MAIKFFKTQKDWRRWLSKNHDQVDVLEVGFYKVDTGKPSARASSNAART